MIFKWINEILIQKTKQKWIETRYQTIFQLLNNNFNKKHLLKLLEFELITTSFWNIRRKSEKICAETSRILAGKIPALIPWNDLQNHSMKELRRTRIWERIRVFFISFLCKLMNELQWIYWGIYTLITWKYLSLLQQ